MRLTGRFRHIFVGFGPDEQCLEKSKAGLASYEWPTPSYEFPRRLSHLQSFGIPDGAARLFGMSRSGHYGCMLRDMSPVEQCLLKPEGLASSGLLYRLISQRVSPVCEAFGPAACA